MTTLIILGIIVGVPVFGFWPTIAVLVVLAILNGASQEENN